MMRKYAFLTTILSISSVAANVSIELPHDQVNLKYSKPVRLEQVLADVAKHRHQSSPNDYLLNNALFNLDKQRLANNKKQSILNKINSLQKNEPQLRHSLGLLYDQVKSWEVSYREALVLDLDAVLLKPSLNPMLEGQYRLTYPKRTDSISLEGLFFTPHRAVLLPDKTVNNYVNTTLRLSSSNNSYVWIIYPDGNYQKVGYTYWNDEHTPIPPGSSLFLGFNSTSTELQQLEEDIVSLLTWRQDK